MQMTKRNLQLLCIAAILGLLLLGAATWVFSLFQQTENGLRTDRRQTIIQGAALYAANCASCHGQNLEGQPNWKRRDPEGYLPAPPHDETGHTWHHSDKVLFELTKNGLGKLTGPDYKTKMPAYGGVLNDSEIIAVLSFIKSRWSKEIRLRHDQLNTKTTGQ